MARHPVATSTRSSSISLIAAAAALSFLFAPAAAAKRLSFELPSYNKLMAGAGPDTNDVGCSGVTENGAAADSAAVDLRPLTLNESNEPAKEDLAGGPSGAVKLKISENAFAPREQAGSGAESSGRAESVANTLGKAGKISRQARRVDVQPLALVETEEEVARKAETILDAEKAQLQDLWQATINRNPDIQFVINKLQPTSDQAHASAYMMKALSQALFGVLSAAPLLAPNPNPGMFMGTNAGASMLASLFQSHEAKQAKKYAISQEQATILYKIVRDVADKLVEHYRDYKKEMTCLDAAERDYADLQAMVAEARIGQDSVKQLEMEYVLRKSRRDIETILENMRRERQQLIDLAGADALARLDQQMNEERDQLNRLTGDSAALARQMKVPVEETASQPEAGQTSVAEKQPGTL